MSTERNGIGDAGSSGIKPDPGDITRGVKTGGITPGQGGGDSGAPTYIPII